MMAPAGYVKYVPVTHTAIKIYKQNLNEIFTEIPVVLFSLALTIRFILVRLAH